MNCCTAHILHQIKNDRTDNMSYTSNTPVSISKGAQILSTMFQRVYILIFDFFFSSIVNMLTSFGIFCPYLPSFTCLIRQCLSVGGARKMDKKWLSVWVKASSVPQFSGLSAILPKDLEPKIKRSDQSERSIVSLE